MFEGPILESVWRCLESVLAGVPIEVVSLCKVYYVYSGFGSEVVLGVV